MCVDVSERERVHHRVILLSHECSLRHVLLSFRVLLCPEVFYPVLEVSCAVLCCLLGDPTFPRLPSPDYLPTTTFRASTELISCVSPAFRLCPPMLRSDARTFHNARTL